MYIQKSQLGGGSPMIRGFSTNRLLITVDGVRMNNATFRGGNIQNVISIDPFTISNSQASLVTASLFFINTLHVSKLLDYLSYFFKIKS